MTPAQCRAARALLDWTQETLASEAHVAVLTIRTFEGEKANPRRATLAAIQRALEAAGVEFLPGGGVRPHEQPAEAQAS